MSSISDPDYSEDSSSESLVEDSPKNPFGAAISNYWKSIKNITFDRPYVPSIIYLLISIFVIALLSIFYLTVGVATQILLLLWYAAIDSFSNMQETKNIIETFSYGVAAGIFIMVSIPFAIIVFPPALVGWIVDILRGLFS